MEPSFQRWTAKRKADLVIEIIKGERKLVDICREHDLKQSEVETWIKIFIDAGEKGLKVTAKDQQNLHEQEVNQLRAKVGELVLELDARKKLEALINSREMTSC